MRTAAGLPSPEERVGQMAHDFAMMACAAEEVVLSCPLRREGAPAVPARWLVRPIAFLDSCRRRSGRTTVPQIFIDGQAIGGSDDLAALERAGKLDALLAA